MTTWRVSMSIISLSFNTLVLKTVSVQRLWHYEELTNKNKPRSWQGLVYSNQLRFLHHEGTKWINRCILLWNLTVKVHFQPKSSQTPVCSCYAGYLQQGQRLSVILSWSDHMMCRKSAQRNSSKHSGQTGGATSPLLRQFETKHASWKHLHYSYTEMSKRNVVFLKKLHFHFCSHYVQKWRPICISGSVDLCFIQSISIHSPQGSVHFLHLLNDWLKHWRGEIEI